jgi:hypothetical protein
MEKWKNLTNAQRETAIMDQKIRLRDVTDLGRRDLGEAVLALMEEAQEQALARKS